MPRQTLRLKEKLAQASTEQERKAILDGLPYAEGWGKPPVRTQFKKGNKSGKGRPRGSENMQTIWEEEFGGTIWVTENGKKKRVQRRRVAMRQLANMASTGKLNAIKIALDLERKAGNLTSRPEVPANAFDERDSHTLEELLAVLHPQDTDHAKERQTGPSQEAPSAPKKDAA